MTTSTRRRWALAPPPDHTLPTRTVSRNRRGRVAGVVVAVLLSAGALLGAVWAAARVAATPGRPVPRLGGELCRAIARTVAESRLEPLTGATGSSAAFWTTLAVFITLLTLIWVFIWTVALAHRPPNHHLAARPRFTTDTTVVPLPWHPRTSTTVPSGHGLTPHLTTHQAHVRSPATPPPSNPTDNPATPERRPGLLVTVGHAAGLPVVIDLCAQHGLGLTGPGADGLARYLFANLITDIDRSDTQTTLHRIGDAVVVIPMDEAESLVGPDIPAQSTGDSTPNGDTAEQTYTRDSTKAGHDCGGSLALAVGRPQLYRAPTLGVALTYLEQHLIAREQACSPCGRNLHAAPGCDDPGEVVPLVLFAEPDASTHARLQAILSHGQHHRIAAILRGPWPTGSTLSLNLDGSVHAASTLSADLATSTTMFTTSPERLRMLLVHREAPAQPPAPMPNTATTSGYSEHSVTGATTEPVRSTAPADTASQVYRAQVPPEQSQSRDATPPSPSADGLGSCVAAQQHHGATPVNDACDKAAGAFDGGADRSDTDDPSAEGTAHYIVGDPAGEAGLASSQAVLVIECFDGLRVYTVTRATIPERAAPDDARREITARLSPQDARLLGCLAIHPRGITTNRLLEIGWPDTPHSAARARLRTALNHLRTTLRDETGLPSGAFATHLGGRYHLGAHPGDPRVEVDYAAFDHAVGSARTQNGQVRIEALQQIATIYTGALLEGIDLDWPELDALQESARRSATAALGHLAEHYEHRNPTHAIELLQKLLTYEPAAQRPASMLITLHLNNQDPQAAHRVYTQLADDLAQLGQQPSHELTKTLRYHPQAIDR